jgi:hypothetical protein
MLDNIVTKLSELYKNRFVNINLNVLLAVAPAFAAAGGVSTLMENMEYSKEAIALGALAADLSIYFPIQGALHYRANQEQYLGEDQKTDWKSFAKDFGHVCVTQIPGLAVISVVCPSAQYYFMNQGMSAGEASQVTYWGLTLLTRTIHSIIGYKTGLFKKPSGL